MADEPFGDALRDLALQKLRRGNAQHGLGAHLQRQIELQGVRIDATLVNRWLRNNAAPPLDSPYLPALQAALNLTPDEYVRLYRAAAHSRGAALPRSPKRPGTGDPIPPAREGDEAAAHIPLIETPTGSTEQTLMPREHRDRRDRWLLLATAIVAAALAIGLSRLLADDPPSSAPTRTPVAPGGKWIMPGPGFVVTGNSLHFAARAYPTNPTDPPVAAVFFTATWEAPDGGWRIACRADAISPGTPDTYECDWVLTINVPNGQITVSFDVYDTSGNSRKAPNGLQRGEVRR